MSAWLIAFWVTVGVEVPVCLWLFRRDDVLVGRSQMKAIMICVGASLVTHPLFGFRFRLGGAILTGAMLRCACGAETLRRSH